MIIRHNEGIAIRTIIFLVICLFGIQVVQAQVGLPTKASASVGSSISSDGTAPNDNAMLDVQSPSTGDGKGILIPRVSLAQRTTANASLAGGLLDDSGNLRGGAAQGLIVYQTDDIQGLYFNTSQTAVPAWAYLGDVAGLLASNVWAAAGSTTNYLPRTGGTMSGALNMGVQIVSNVAYIDFSGNSVSIGRGANGSTYGAAVGRAANSYNSGVAVGDGANGYNIGAAVGHTAIGTSDGAAMGNQANGSTEGAAMGKLANGFSYGAAIGHSAKGTNYGAAVGYQANGAVTGVAVGASANGFDNGAAVGYLANGANYGAAMGYLADGYAGGVALGRSANGSIYSAALGYQANSYWYGVAVGTDAKGTNYGAAVGTAANGSSYGAAMGRSANGARTNVAIGAYANAQGGTERIAIGHNVTNEVDGTAVIRGHLYLDGGTGMWYRTSFGNGSWTAKAFEIDHPLDPENKVLRHFCLEGPQVWNVYAGNAQLVNGFAVVELPDYYSALNLVGSEIYSLTVVEGTASHFPQVKVIEKVTGNRFIIAGTDDIEVSWTIKVLRNDPGCLEDLKSRPAEQLKNEIR